MEKGLAMSHKNIETLAVEKIGRWPGNAQANQPPVAPRDRQRDRDPVKRPPASCWWVKD